MAHDWTVAEGSSGFSNCSLCHELYYFDAVGAGAPPEYAKARKSSARVRRENPHYEDIAFLEAIR